MVALITRVADASLDAVTAMKAPQLSGLFAGEDLDVAAPCYIKSSDGLVYLSNGTAADEEAEVVGFTGRHVHSGEPVTLFGIGARFQYGTGLTPGDIYYLGATNGRLDATPTTGDAFGYAAAVSATDIVVIRGQPVFTSATVGAGTIGTTQLADVGVTEAKLEVGAATDGITGLVAMFVANANVVGGIPVVHVINVADASGNTDVTLTHKTKILFAGFKNTGIAAHATTDTVQLVNVTNAITAAVPKTATVNAVIYFPTLIEAYDTIAAGTVLRVTAAKTTNAACTVFVIGIRVA